jgi:hypothetical protein
MFVFFHAGSDPSPSLLVKSLRKYSPGKPIIQCSDILTAPIDGVDDVKIFSGEKNNIMRFRLQAFHKLGLEEPAIYLDTDMLCLKNIDARALLSDFDVKLCLRSFHREAVMHDKPINGVRLTDHVGKTFFETFPYVACFTITKNAEFWGACCNEIDKLDEKYLKWFGDQEAMRNVVDQNLFKFGFLDESYVACLPENYRDHKEAAFTHFKGHRKRLMHEVAVALQV